ncbi:MAG TPA: ribosome biogenesis GTPase Der [Dehalococcoidia bacterium]|nr:ribosome biogenesis GTPase Der [Dehalococcoidia bacterium]
MIEIAAPPNLAIVGRPNVGKSSLFNRLVGRRIALVEDLSGTTRDRIDAELDWHGRTIRITDTGGLETAPTGLYPKLIREQIEAAMKEANAILFVVDGRDGLTAEDYAVADLLRRAVQPVLLVANKVDNERREMDTVQFYKLGLGDPIPVSAFHGHGVEEMVDLTLERLDDGDPVTERPVTGPALAIVGRPNAGKSALLNAVLGQERVIVSEVPGTTRDAIDTVLEYEGQSITLIDTAGIRRRGHIVPGVERHSVMRAAEAVNRCDVALVLMDATDPATAQDTHIVQIAAEAYKGVVLTVSKIDLLYGGYKQDLTSLLRQRFRFVPWAPIAFTSATEGAGLEELIKVALLAAEQRNLRVATGPMNNLLQRAIVEHPPRSVQGRRLKLLYATQADVRPPTFVLFVNDVHLLHFSYRRYLENRLRQAYGFVGTAIHFVFKSRGEMPLQERITQG